MRLIGMMLFVVVVAVVPGCTPPKSGDRAASGKPSAFVKSSVEAKDTDSPDARGGDRDRDKNAKDKDGDKGRDKAKIGAGTEKPSPVAAADPAPKAEMPAAAVADAVVGREPRVKKLAKNDLPSGVLTAGSFDDNVDPFVFNRYAKWMNQTRGLGDLVSKMQGQRVLVIVKDAAGKPVGNARVALSAGAGAPVELLTRSDGRAVFMLSLDQLPADQALKAIVTGPNGGAAVTESIAVGSARWEITLPSAQAQLPRTLDLAIVLDTTGSMQGEIDHLKAEVRGISAAIAKKFPEVKQRFSLILYRDDGDDYVVRPFDFTDSLDVFHKRIADQRAAGGGDYPEAMHRGLEESLQLRWSTGSDAARVMFLIADAPPHAQHMNRTLAVANALRKKGVTIYPVACKGYDPACEFVMRTCAMLTGGQFVFLTDDSGVGGGGHAEPTIPYYEVERLEKLMIRAIASELSGRPVLANPADIIRTVGKKVN